FVVVDAVLGIAVEVSVVHEDRTDRFRRSPVRCGLGQRGTESVEDRVPVRVDVAPVDDVFGGPEPGHLREEGGRGLATTLDHDRVAYLREPEAAVAVLHDEHDTGSIGDLVHVSGGPGVVSATAGRQVTGI